MHFTFKTAVLGAKGQRGHVLHVIPSLPPVSCYSSAVSSNKGKSLEKKPTNL